MSDKPGNYAMQQIASGAWSKSDTADAAKLLHYAKHHMGCPKWGPSATAASKCECGLDDLANSVNTRPQPAPPAGEPDFDIMNGELEQEFYRTGGDRTHGYIRRYLVTRAYRLGLAARPKVEDAEVAALCAELRRPSGIGEPVDHASMSKAAFLLERLAGELTEITADRDGWKQQHENLLHVRQTDIENLAAKIEKLEAALGKSAIDLGVAFHKHDKVEAKLSEREAELAKAAETADKVAAKPPATPNGRHDDWQHGWQDGAMEVAAALREAHAARQRQKASAEPTAREGG